MIFAWLHVYNNHKIIYREKRREKNYRNKTQRNELKSRKRAHARFFLCVEWTIRINGCFVFIHCCCCRNIKNPVIIITSCFFLYFLSFWYGKIAFFVLVGGIVGVVYVRAYIYAANFRYGLYFFLAFFSLSIYPNGIFLSLHTTVFHAI